MTKEQVFRKQTEEAKLETDYKDLSMRLYKRIADLEKENAELKEKIEVLECDNYNANCNLNLITDQLTKAKEIIREIMKYEIPTLDYEKAEQFLKEIEK